MHAPGCGGNGGRAGGGGGEAAPPVGVRKADKVDILSTLRGRLFPKNTRGLFRLAQSGRTGGEGLISPGGPATTLTAMGKSGGDGNRREPCRKCLL